MQTYEKTETPFQSEILAGANSALAELDKRSEQVGIFTIKDGNQWLNDASKKIAPEALYLALWFQGEVCMMFADTNLGKSIFAVQMAVQIAEKHTVLYIDFELSDKQFENRYSINYASHYRFPANFYRAEINTNEADHESAGFKTIEDYLAASIKRAIIELNASVVIIDNLTYLKTETEKSKDALPLMKELKQLKNEFNLSILCLAHTPKRDLSKPISRNDLAGSKMLMNFCDSAFAIGESTQDKGARYVKQIKARNTEIVYDSENVAVYQIVKPDNFLHFSFTGYSSERHHLKQITEMDIQNQKAKIFELSDSGRSLRQIAAEVGVNHMKVDRILKERNKV